jgi:hypothetical protein
VMSSMISSESFFVVITELKNHCFLGPGTGYLFS